MVYADDLAEDLVPLLSPVPNRVRVDGIFNAVQGRTLKAPVRSRTTKELVEMKNESRSTVNFI